MSSWDPEMDIFTKISKLSVIPYFFLYFSTYLVPPRESNETKF